MECRNEVISEPISSGFNSGVSKLQPAGRMRPSKAYYAARGDFVKV